MTDLDRELQELQEKAARKQHLASIEATLQGQRPALHAEVERLDTERRAEQADVDRLEGHSLAAWFFALTGRKEERLDKERAEAYAAAVRYDAAKAKLDAVDQQLAQVRRELSELAGTEEAMARLLAEKRQYVKASDPENGARLWELEGRIAELDAQWREIQEGLSAGRDVLDQIGQIEGRLSSAEGLGTWDLIGGGMLVSMAKHSELDEAQRMAERLQILLQRFRTELSDVEVYAADLRLDMDGVLRFTDCFFDNIFSDWAALDHIRASQSRVAEMRRQVEQVMYRLGVMQGQIADARRAAEEEISNLLVGTV